MRFISTGNNRDGYRGLTVFHVKLLDVDAAFVTVVDATQ